MTDPWAKFDHPELLVRPAQKENEPDLGGSGVSVGLGGLNQTPPDVLTRLSEWLARFIRTTRITDIYILALWILHTHVIEQVYTSPRLLIDSAMPGSGKTTVLEHTQRLGYRPIQAASLSSPALLARIIDAGIRTICIDEADRNLDPKREGVGELLAVLNSGYKRGATRPVLVPAKGGTWEVAEMATFAPIAMAGNQPNLPEDTRSRTIRILLMPDLDGTVEESDWELIEPLALDLRETIEQWADEARHVVAGSPGNLPDIIKGRARERWKPLKKVAQAVGGDWPALVDELASADVELETMEREDGMTRERPAVVLLRDVHSIWAVGEQFTPTATLVKLLIEYSPMQWSALSSFGRDLTPQRLGRMLSSNFGIHSTRNTKGERGYSAAPFLAVWQRMGLGEPPRPPEPSEPAGTVES